MTKIPCSLILDLLPTYAEGLCSQDSEALVREHIECCETCRGAWEAVKAPVAVEDSQKKKNMIPASPLKKIRKKHLIQSASALLVIGMLILFPFFADQVEFLRDIFWPSQLVSVQVGDVEGAWYHVDFEEGFLIYDSIFYERGIVNYMDNQDPGRDITIRIKDMEGNVVIDAVTIPDGRRQLLDLERGVPYQVEIQAEPGVHLLTFV